MKALILLGLVACSLLGCSTPKERPATSRGARILGIGSSRAEDPVSGAVVDKDHAVVREYRGTMYYFESPDTAATFMANPTEFSIPESEGREGRVDVR
jgi:YHS domain-containing protein